MSQHPAFDFEVVTPEGASFRGRVTSIRLPGKDGSFGILARHAPLVGALAAGVLHVEGEDGKKAVYAVGEGFVEARKAKDGKGTEVRALVDFCDSKDDIDVVRARKAKERAQERLKERAEHVDMARAEASLRRALVRISVAEYSV